MNFDEVASIEEMLATKTFGRALRLIDRCGSTNDEAAAWAREGAPEGAVVMADEQTSGRGRLGRSWHSPAGENLYLSLILRPKIDPQRAPPLTLVAAVALAEAVEECGGDVELKWPNDLLLGGLKVAGILTEMATSGRGIEHVVIGIGLNFYEREFPAELAGKATSLALATGLLRRPMYRTTFAAGLLGRLEPWYLRFLEGGPAEVVTAWSRRARLFGTRVEVQTGREPVRGVAERLDDDGALLVRTDAGQLARVVAGELS